MSNKKNDTKTIKQLLNLPSPEVSEYIWEIQRNDSIIQLLILQNEDLSFSLEQKVKNTKIQKILVKSSSYSVCVLKVNSLIKAQEEKGFFVITKPDLYK